MGKNGFSTKRQLTSSISLPVPTLLYQIIIEYLSLRRLVEAWYIKYFIPFFGLCHISDFYRRRAEGRNAKY